MSDQRFCFEPHFYFRGHGTAFGHRLGSLAMVSLPIIGGLTRSSARGKQIARLGLKKLAWFSEASSFAQGRGIPSRQPSRFETTVTAKLKDFCLRNNTDDYKQDQKYNYRPPLFEAGRIIGSIYSLYDEREESGSRQNFFMRHPNLAGFQNSDIQDAFVLGHRIIFDIDQQLAHSGNPTNLSDSQKLVQTMARGEYQAYSLVKRIGWEDESSAEKLHDKGFVVRFGEKCGQEFIDGPGHAVMIGRKDQDEPLAILRFGEVLRAERSTRLVMLRFKRQYSRALQRDIQEYGQGAYDYDYSSGEGVGSDVGSNGKPL